jgi:hypothetical protein
MNSPYHTYVLSSYISYNKYDWDYFVFLYVLKLISLNKTRVIFVFTFLIVLYLRRVTVLFSLFTFLHVSLVYLVYHENSNKNNHLYWYLLFVYLIYRENYNNK